MTSNNFRTLGTSTHAVEDRQVDDYYATDPNAIDLLLQVEEFDGKVWECACGEGHLSKKMTELGMNVLSTDLIDRGYGTGGIDFVNVNEMWVSGFAYDVKNIITNPPYKLAQEFIEKSLQVIPHQGKVAMFLKLQFMEGKKRKQLFAKYPPKTIYVSSSRIQCAKNGDFELLESKGGSAVAYARYVWEKGYNGKTSIEWIN